MKRSLILLVEIVKLMKSDIQYPSACQPLLF